MHLLLFLPNLPRGNVVANWYIGLLGRTSIVIEDIVNITGIDVPY